MIEEIKKEIIDEYNMHFEVAEININTLFKILDKYKDISDEKLKDEYFELKKYKIAFIELKKMFVIPKGAETIFDLISFLEKKHGIGVE